MFCKKQKKHEEKTNKKRKTDKNKNKKKERKVQSSQLFQAVDEGDVTKIEGLIEQGVNVNTSRSESLIHTAIKKGNKKIIKLLINAGCSPNTKNYGLTANQLAESKGIKLSALDDDDETQEKIESISEPQTYVTLPCSETERWPIIKAVLMGVLRCQKITVSSLEIAIKSYNHEFSDWLENLAFVFENPRINCKKVIPFIIELALDIEKLFKNCPPIPFLSSGGDSFTIPFDFLEELDQKKENEKSSPKKNLKVSMVHPTPSRMLACKRIPMYFFF
eukprot:c14196_g2_i1.p1 GENE.c14196_g2_i1~~c14196_g2_i1.p1  ORF type:complete len:276 (-),score=48.86 c14196_g2_i1:157-984(-)